MNGPDHYKEAERILELANDQSNLMHVTQQQALIAQAQVHATLALAAATALPAAQTYYGDESKAVRGWAQVIDA